MSTPEPTTVATVRDAAMSLGTQERQVDLIAAAATSRGQGQWLSKQTSAVPAGRRAYGWQTEMPTIKCMTPGYLISLPKPQFLMDKKIITVRTSLRFFVLFKRDNV